MPVRGHQAIAQDADGVSFQGLVEYPQESGVVGGFAKQLEPARSRGSGRGRHNLPEFGEQSVAWAEVTGGQIN